LISEAKAKASEAAEECFSNVRTVKAFSTEDQETVNYWNKNEAIFSQENRAARAYGCF